MRYRDKYLPEYHIIMNDKTGDNPPQKPNVRRICLALTDAQYNRLKQVARERDELVAEVARDLVKEGLETVESDETKLVPPEPIKVEVDTCKAEPVKPILPIMLRLTGLDDKKVKDATKVDKTEAEKDSEN